MAPAYPKSPFQKPSVQIISLSDDGSEAPTTVRHNFHPHISPRVILRILHSPRRLCHYIVNLCCCQLSDQLDTRSPVMVSGC